MSDLERPAAWGPCPSCGVPYGHLHKENCSCLQPSPDAGASEHLQFADALEAKDAEIAEWAKAGTRWSEKMSEAQAEIERLQDCANEYADGLSQRNAEIERLREALEKVFASGTHAFCIDVARAALGEKP
jgi:DNA repair exonuclease SbcCD ATPase subunit